jgi:hypothetical protein
MADKTMTEGMGGEIAAFLKTFTGKEIVCFGVCGKIRLMEGFKGYEHTEGLADATGKRWWVFFECPQCGYGHSFGKMKFFLDRTKIEQEATGEQAKIRDALKAQRAKVKMAVVDLPEGSAILTAKCCGLCNHPLNGPENDRIVQANIDGIEQDCHESCVEALRDDV